MEIRWDSEVIIIIVCSFAKQLVKCPLGFLQSLVRADASWPVALREVEVFTEVRPFFFVTNSARRSRHWYATTRSWKTQLRQGRRAN